jgi:uncharacterized protein (TIGR03083 family)
MTDHAAAYRSAHDRIVELAREGPEVPVPATPGWTVQDLVAHLGGLAADWAHGRLDGYASAAWTARHVSMRADWSLAAVIEEWAGNLSDVERVMADPHESGLPDPLMTAFGPVAAAAWPDIIVTDIALHEHDIRSALGRPGARGSDAVRIALRSHVGLLRFIQAATGLPPLRLVATDDDVSYAVGREAPAVTLEASLYELFRATGGRRSLAQLAAMAWSPDPAGWLDHIVMPSYSIPADDLVE